MATLAEQTYLERNLREVRSGRVSRAAGIRRCGDCREPYIDDHSGLSYCPGCRTAHLRYCAQCRQTFANTPDGERLCECCRDQVPLFDLGP